MKRLPLITSFILFIALCMSLAYWAMQMFKPPVRGIAAPPLAERPAPLLDAAAGLLGGRASVAAASNFQLKGVVVAANPAESVAVLAVNGKPAQKFRTGQEAAPGVTLAEVQYDHVLLSEGGATKRVDLPKESRKQMSVGAYTSPPGTAPAPAPASHPSHAVPSGRDIKRQGVQPPQLPQ